MTPEEAMIIALGIWLLYCHLWMAWAIVVSVTEQVARLLGPIAPVVQRKALHVMEMSSLKFM